jgi:hypothetical protein
MHCGRWRDLRGSDTQAGREARRVAEKDYYEVAREHAEITKARVSTDMESICLQVSI